jgi:N-methylhydantoinase A
MLMADVIKDYSLTVMRNQMTVTGEALSQLFKELEKRGTHDLVQEGIPEGNVTLERYLDMRYEGQSYEIIVPFGDNYVQDFHAYHEKTYGYRNEDKIIEIVNIRLRARGIPDKPRFQRDAPQGERPSQDAFLDERDVVFDREVARTKIIQREKLMSGNRVKGPAVIVEYSSTIVIPPFAGAFVDGHGNLVMEIES